MRPRIASRPSTGRGCRCARPNARWTCWASSSCGPCSPTRTSTASGRSSSRRSAPTATTRRSTSTTSSTRPSSATRRSAGRWAATRRGGGQAHLCLGVPALRRDHPDTWTLELLTAVLGDGSSSRLFLSVREEAGLAYDVHSFTTDYADCGTLQIYAGVDPDDLGAGLEAILTELARLRDTPVPAPAAAPPTQTPALPGRLSRDEPLPPAVIAPPRHGSRLARALHLP